MTSPELYEESFLVVEDEAIVIVVIDPAHVVTIDTGEVLRPVP